MTITEHLEFSVLSAPIATIDRRVLSQAWYSALYGTPAPSAVQTPPNMRPAARRAARTCRHESNPLAHSPASNARSVHAASPQRDRLLEGETVERRAPRSQLARKIEQRLLHPRKRARNETFALGEGEGRVQILFQERGSRLRLVAICTARHRPQVAAALVQARYALALRGIDLDAQTRALQPC